MRKLLLQMSVFGNENHELCCLTSLSEIISHVRRNLTFTRYKFLCFSFWDLNEGGREANFGQARSLFSDIWNLNNLYVSILFFCGVLVQVPYSVPEPTILYCFEMMYTGIFILFSLFLNFFNNNIFILKFLTILSLFFKRMSS
jgi:hypothetical protein